MKMLLKSLTFLSVVISSARGMYLPGVAPHSFADGEEVELKVNKLRYLKRYKCDAKSLRIF